MSEEINTFIPRVQPETNLLTKYIAQTAYDLSYLDGKENLQAIKSVAAGATIYPPDHREEILESLDALELSDDSINDLSEEEIEELIEKRKQRQQMEEMLILERKEARATFEELKVKSTGTTENPSLTIMAPESKEAPVIDKSSKVAKTYTPPPAIELDAGESGVTLTISSSSDSSSEKPGIFKPGITNT